SDSGRNPPPVTIHTWLERFNKQKPRSFEKATAPVDAENWISHLEKIFNVMGSAGTAKEQANNFQWGLRRSTLNHLMCMPFTDVAQVANAARNYEILHERDDDDAERPDKRQKSGDRHQPTTQQSSHRNHGHNNDRHRSDRRGGGDNHHSSNNNYSGNNNRNSGNGRDQKNKGQQSNRSVNSGNSSPGVPLRATPTRNSGCARDQRNMGHQSNRSANSGSQQSKGPSEGYSYPVCTTCGRRHPGECRRAAVFLITYIPGFLRTTTLLPLCHVYLFISLCFSLSLYPFTERYAQPYFFSCLIRQSFSSYFMHVILIRAVDVFFRLSRLLFKTFKTLCLLKYALMKRHDYDITSSLRRGALHHLPRACLMMALEGFPSSL
nr:zinc finger, CCHC-type, retrotransposon Gag domain protein [Tanacetum cinerariifolium]